MNIKSTLIRIKNKESNPLDTFILYVIIFSSILIGLETSPTISNYIPGLFYLLDIFILIIFIIEMTIKMIAEGNKPWRYFYDPWNLFDFIIIVLSFLPYFLTAHQVDTHALMTFRIFRIARAFRAFRVFRLITKMKPLQVIIETLIKSLPSMAAVFLLLGILFYIYGVLGVFLFGKYDAPHFQSLGTSILTLFTCLSGSWTELMETIMKQGVFEYYFVPIYFISFYFIAGLIIINLCVGVIVDQLSTTRIQKEIEEIREGYIDDLTAEQIKKMDALEKKLLEINDLFKDLKIVLNKDKN